jgi:hypothetical protein
VDNAGEVERWEFVVYRDLKNRLRLTSARNMPMMR